MLDGVVWSSSRSRTPVVGIHLSTETRADRDVDVVVVVLEMPPVERWKQIVRIDRGCVACHNNNGCGCVVIVGKTRVLSGPGVAIQETGKKPGIAVPVTRDATGLAETVRTLQVPCRVRLDVGGTNMEERKTRTMECSRGTTGLEKDGLGCSHCRIRGEPLASTVGCNRLIEAPGMLHLVRVCVTNRGHHEMEGPKGLLKTIIVRIHKKIDCRRTGG